LKLRVSREMSWRGVDANENEDEDKRRELPVNIVLLLQRKSLSTKRVCTN
jgi:hypothetical protein